MSEPNAAPDRAAAPVVLNLDLLPRPAGDPVPRREVVLLVDVLRTTTTAPILFDQGLERLRLSPSLRAARVRARADDELLIGERGGVPPEGFNHGNSPATLALHDLRGRRAVMVSENGPAALPRLVDAEQLLLASLVNAGAAVRRAAGFATRRIDLVCCGFRGEPDLDDLLTAGFLADRLLRLRPELVPAGATRMAIDLMRAEPDPLRLLWASRAGRYLRRLGLERDLGIAADVDRSTVVPVLARPEEHDGSVLYPFVPAEAA